MAPTLIDIALVHEDEHLLVLDKPAGLLAVPGRGEDKQDCLSARAQARWPDALVVHRLDMATSGLMLMGRGPFAQRALGEAFARRDVAKRYEAVVQGRPSPGSSHDTEGWQVIDLPIAVDWPRRPLRIIDAALGKPSVTRWRVKPLDARAPAPPDFAGATRVELEPVTGRSHQLRVHLRAIGHPILGDALYGDETACAAAPRLLLHACSLALAHPVTSAPLSFTSPAPF